MMGFWQSIKQFLAEGFEIISMIPSSLSDKPDAWEWSISRFEAQDRVSPPPKGAIVFTGSSSITFWKTLEQDMAPLPVINRGFGGSKIHQVAHYVDRIVAPYHPRAVVLFAGTNDIAGPKPRTAQQVLDGYLAFVRAVHAALPETPIYYISITPTPSRWKYWPAVREANCLIKAHTGTDLRLHFIDMTDAILGPDGKPNRGLFRIDRLHPNQAGYAQWTATIKPVLLADLRGS
jgi:lysophospholipase L1-like esterase